MNKHGNQLSLKGALGIGLIIFGVLLFLSNIGIPLLGMILRNWPVLLIIAGAVMLRQRRKTGDTGSHKYLPHALLAAGIVFQLANMHMLHFGLGAILVPVILLFLGLQLLRATRPGIVGDDPQLIEGELVNDSAPEDSEDHKIDVFTLLGAGNFATRSQKLVGGSATALLGGVEIDLHEADTQASRILLDVTAIMGGVEIRVPPHFQVQSKVLPLLGGVSNKTTCLADKLGVPPKQLVITGLALMGGVEITN